MSAIGIDFSEVTKLFSKMARMPGAIAKAVDPLQEEAAKRLVVLIQQKASGRPGPNVISGAYRSSWHAVGNRAVTDAPQAKRLEYGFAGTDSLGRNYAQPPFPHVGPATREFRPEFTKMLRDLPITVWRSL